MAGGERKKKRKRKKERGVGAGSTVFQSACTLRTQLSLLLQGTELRGLKPQAAGWGPPPLVSDRTAGSPASPVGFALLGHLLRQFLQNSFFQGQVLSKWKAVQVPCDFALSLEHAPFF